MRGPFLSNAPVVTVEEPRSTYHFETLEEIFIRDPKNAVVSKLVVQLLDPVCSPFFGSITPRAIPLSDAAGITEAPWISSTV
jgi:hypothetical protein